MFQRLRKHSKILVTGPMRSGTTICAKMIAQDTGHAIHFEEELLVGAWMFDSPYVLQSPYLLQTAKELDESWMIVFMVRDMDAVTRSADKAIKQMLGVQLDYEQLDRHMQEQARLVEVMREKTRAQHMLVQYESLRAHPLWFENRRNWGPRQTEEGCVEAWTSTA